jgi:hypothetical protein
VVGPLLLVVAFGLARAGSVGIGAVAIMVVLVLQPITRVGGLPLPRDAKSNGHGVAAVLAPRLRTNDVVVVAQPEAVPLFRAELGDDLVYADPTGVVDDPTIMDWRDAEARLRQSSIENLEALVDDIEVGTRVAVIVPGNAPADTDTDWIRLFRASGRRFTRALRADEDFELVTRLRGTGRSYVTFDAAVWERVSP